MTRFVVDTNVPIVANGLPDKSRGQKPPHNLCRIAAVEFLINFLSNGQLLLDLDGEIQSEYAKNLSAEGRQPGVGDRFYLAVIYSAPHLIERVALPKRSDGEYVDLPQPLIEANFDPSDRKFAALAKRERVPVINATDSDWLDHSTLLKNNGVRVKFVCGSNKAKWFNENE